MRRPQSGSQFVNTLLFAKRVALVVLWRHYHHRACPGGESFGRVVLKLNCMSILGLQAGRMTDPPALAFANPIAGSSYASVYPLTMLLRITVAQVLVILLAK